MSEKIIRDPVHDVIAFRTDRPTDALLFRLLNAAEFQRLRRCPPDFLIGVLEGLDEALDSLCIRLGH